MTLHRSIARLVAAALAAGAVFVGVPAAHAQLTENDVLVVYDSRLLDGASQKHSLLVAEHYAGSAKVPGGVGGKPGVHPRVRVVDLASTGAPVTTGPDITYTDFAARLRNPLRSYLASTNLAKRIRCIVLTKGIPHRILNIRDDPGAGVPANVGDNPGLLNAAFGGNLTFSSVDAELTLLQQDLNSGEAGGNGDSRADGWILNPYWAASLPIRAWSTRFITSFKPLISAGGGSAGILWDNDTDLSLPSTLGPGDFYLVCRLDGNSVADVRAMIDRAQNILVPTGGTAAFLLDKEDANNNSIDTDDLDTYAATGATENPSDYPRARTALLADGRFAPASAVLNTASGLAGFIVGPNATFAGSPPVLSTPLLLLASFGANHSGVTDFTTKTTYGTSFNLLPGAVFNTIESYNGRAFGGLGQNPFVPQQQSADFLADRPTAGGGGTLAIGNVWEPLAYTVADNRYITQNFFAGNLSWAEAAYTALPVLSWQQIVLGDPLARARRDRDDVNGDGRVDVDDLYAWIAAPTDINRSGAPDNADLLLLEQTVRAHESINMKYDQR